MQKDKDIQLSYLTFLRICIVFGCLLLIAMVIVGSVHLEPTSRYLVLLMAGSLVIFFTFIFPRKIIFYLYPAALVTVVGEVGNISFFKIVAGATFISYVYLLAKHRITIRWPPQTTWLIIAIVFSLFSMWFNRHNPDEIDRWLGRSFLTFMPFVMANLISTEERLRRFLMIGVVATSISLGIASLFSDKLFGDAFRLSGTFLGRWADGVSTTGTIMLPILIYFAIELRSNFRRMCLALCGFVIVFACSLTFSRMGIISLVFITLWLILRVRKLRIKIPIAILFTTFLLSFFFITEFYSKETVHLSLKHRFSALLDFAATKQDRATHLRASVLYPAGLAAIREYPFWGVGLTGFDAYARMHSPIVNIGWPSDRYNLNTHNLIIELLAQQGIFVTVAMLIAIGLSIKYLWRATRLSRLLRPYESVSLFETILVSTLMLIGQSLLRDAFNDKFIYFAIGYGMVAWMWIKSQRESPYKT